MSKLALVTGGSRGIGRAICLRLAQEGYDLVLNYQSGSAAAEETVKMCQAYQVKAYALQADVSQSLDCENLVAKALEYGNGRIDVLVNNAGVTCDGLMGRMKDEDFQKVIDTNLMGSFYMMRAVTKSMMKARQGRIINMSSVVGLHGNAGQVNYAASKAGIIGMTKSAAKELASRNITVNAIAPGMIETDMTGILPEAIKEEMLKTIPLRRMGKTEDVANAVAFLADEKSGYITGQILSVDGGMN